MDTDARIGDDPREVFRVVKKALAVKIQKGIHVLNIAPLGEVIIDKTGVENSNGHFTRNAKTNKEHKQRVRDAFALVPDVLERGVLVEYGTQVDNDRLRSYLYVAPVTIGQETCIMAVRVRCQQKQAKRFYLHGVALLDDLKQKSLVPSAIRRVGLGTENRIGDDPREVFRVVKKALAVKIQKGEITGGYSLCVGKKAKNWKSLPGERKFKSVLDGRMRCEHSAFTRANR